MEWIWHWLGGSIGTWFVVSPLITTLGKLMHVSVEHRVGVVEIQRTILISHYNKYTCGVDLADMQWLHWNAMVMGLNWWWLKLLFYFLDFCAANYLLLYRLSMNNESMNISIFKLVLESSIFGKRIKTVPLSPKEVSHNLVHIYMNNTSRHLCDLFAFFYNKKITRYKCQTPECNMPLRSFGYHSGPRMVQYRFTFYHHTS